MSDTLFHENDSLPISHSKVFIVRPDFSDVKQYLAVSISLFFLGLVVLYLIIQVCNHYRDNIRDKILQYCFHKTHRPRRTVIYTRNAERSSSLGYLYRGNVSELDNMTDEGVSSILEEDHMRLLRLRSLSTGFYSDSSCELFNAEFPELTPISFHQPAVLPRAYNLERLPVLPGSSQYVPEAFERTTSLPLPGNDTKSCYDDSDSIYFPGYNSMESDSLSSSNSSTDQCQSCELHSFISPNETVIETDSRRKEVATTNSIPTSGTDVATVQSVGEVSSGNNTLEWDFTYDQFSDGGKVEAAPHYVRQALSNYSYRVKGRALSSSSSDVWI